MSIYNSDATSSSFSILGNNSQPAPAKGSRGSRGSGKSAKSTNIARTTAQIGSNVADEAPNVVGLSRIAAINTLIAEGFGYSISYTTSSATSQNNDTVASQSMADFIVVLSVYQFVGSVPGAPTINSVTAGNGSVSVAFTAGTSGTTSTTSYTVVSTPGNISASGSSSPITVSGLTNGTAYTFKVKATNSIGDSPLSSASQSVTPTAYNPPLSLQYLVVAGGGGGGGSTSNDFSGGGGGGGVRSSITGFSSGGGANAENVYSITSGTINVLVGAGGPGGSTNVVGYNGSNSSFGSITAIGGGGGANSNSTSNGGCGGGGAWSNYFGSATGGGLGTVNQGYDGGSGGTRSGGGGGGAGGAGSAGFYNTIADGGSPLTITFGETSLSVSRGGQGSSDAGSGADANGSGGGGGGGAGNYGKAGNSGTVFIRYPNTYSLPVSTTNASSIDFGDGYRTYFFSSNGSITF